jgi:hypothetical protein
LIGRALRDHCSRGRDFAGEVLGLHDPWGRNISVTPGSMVKTVMPVAPCGR